MDTDRPKDQSPREVDQGADANAPPTGGKSLPSWGRLVRDLAGKVSLLLRVGWIFIVPLVVLAVLAVALLVLPQGKDVVVLANEGRLTMFAACFAMAFMAFALWYVSRLLAYAHEDTLNHARVLQLHLPRFIGSNCFNVVLLAQMCSGAFGWELPASAATALLVIVTPFWYLLLHRVGMKVAPLPLRARGTPGSTERDRRVHWNVRKTLFILSTVLLAGLLLSSGHNAVPSIAGHLIAQLAFQVYVAGRSDWMGALKGEGGFARLAGKWKVIGAINRAFAPFVDRYISVNRYFLGPMGKRYAGFRVEAELSFFGPFFLLGIVLFALFVSAGTDVHTALQLGSLAVVLLGLSFLALFLSFCELTYRLKGVNVFAFLLLFALVAGQFGEPHDIALVPAPRDEEHALDRRAGLREHFTRWYEAHRPAIDTAAGIYPMIYVLADGGASRSGYWVASVLGRLEDSTAGVFSRHLFCLSGASGGSVGNGTFHALLLERDRMGRAGMSFEDTARAILKGDLVSHTLARMLGTDMVNLVCPPMALPDRALALERSLEHAASTAGLPDAFARTFSELRRADEGTGPPLPILCINATRMQDGRPAVISTIRMESDIFNRRLDVLDLLPADMDMRLSTAMITGARFPYISPAGRVSSKLHGEHYFVDGGYFDNSGAGVVLEMIQWIDYLLPLVVKDTTHRARLQPYVIHIGNSGLVKPELSGISPVVNDLAAPIKTLIGAYGMQTDINNQRLENHLRQRYSAEDHYLEIQLYRQDAEHESYPMNWVISRRMREQMDQRLNDHEQLAELLSWMRGGFAGDRPAALPNAWARSSGQASSELRALQQEYRRLPVEKRQFFAPDPMPERINEMDAIEARP